MRLGNGRDQAFELDSARKCDRIKHPLTKVERKSLTYLKENLGLFLSHRGGIVGGLPICITDLVQNSVERGKFGGVEFPWMFRPFLNMTSRDHFCDFIKIIKNSYFLNIFSPKEFINSRGRKINNLATDVNLTIPCSTHNTHTQLQSSIKFNDHIFHNGEGVLTVLNNFL